MKRRKKLPPKRHSGLQIYCSKCRKYFSYTSKTITKKNGDKETIEPDCGEEKKKYSKCPYFDKHNYKAIIHIPGTKSGKTSKTLTATKYDEAVIQTIEFRKEVHEELFSLPVEYDTSVKTTYLFDAQIAYLDFLDNIGVPEQEKVQRGDRHIKEQAKCLELFNEVLKKKKIGTKTTPIHKIDKHHVGYFHKFLLEDMAYANKTYNNKMGSLKSFFDWAFEQYNVNQKNPFNKVKERSHKTNIETITGKEFLALINPNNMCKENGQVTTGIKRKYKRNLYRDYLSDGLELALHTGGRREEVVELRWNMIRKINGEISYIEFNNLKVERMLGEGFNDNVDKNIIPITKDLKDLLLRLGYDKYKNTSNYLLCPDRKEQSTSTIMDNLSKGFTHFYKRLNTGRELQMKCLRKTYLTYLKLATGNDMRKLDSHSTDEVLNKHYIDTTIIKKAISEMSIFGDSK